MSDFIIREKIQKDKKYFDFPCTIPYNRGQKNILEDNHGKRTGSCH